MTEGKRYLWNVIPAEAEIQVEETGSRIKSGMTLYRARSLFFFEIRVLDLFRASIFGFRAYEYPTGYIICRGETYEYPR
jgi:hypothetical protein